MSDSKEIAKITFNNSKPTALKLKQLHNWVVWQFPKQVAQGFCGAVHPPLEKHGWLPAVIYPEKREAHIHSHLSDQFITPESAAEHCLLNGRSPDK